MKREVKFSLVFRDMWQSAGKYVPRVDQLVKVAPAIIEMGCFARVETNGGGFEQVNLLFGENPNKAVREWTKPFHEAGIQTHMLDRALNGLRMSPVPADVRKLFYKVKKAQGTDITRTFCGLNDVRNIAPSITYAKEAGMISQCSLCITHSPIHTVEYYTNMALELIKLGADEICIKDMAGIGRPVSLGKIVANIKAAHPEIPVQYHSHAGPGFNMASILEVCEAGCDYIDVGMEPLSWGTGHADLLSVQAMLKDAGYQVPEINMEAYMKVRGMIQEFMDDFLGLYISPKNRLMNSLLIAPGLPGGMMGSLMADLESNLESINKYKAKHNLPFMTQDQLLIKLFDEVAYVWPRVGYPPLVTPFSQYVKNLAMMNVMAMEKGKERWGMIADDIWDMILGKAGRLPGKLAPEIVEKAEREGRKFFEGDPQNNYPDALDKYRKLMKENKWEVGQDDEELFEYAMHPAQYEAYKSGKAKEDFLEDVAKRRAEKDKSPEEDAKPKTLTVQVDGQAYRVTVAYGDTELPAAPAGAAATPAGEGKEVLSPLEGKFFLVKGAQETPLQVGDTVKEGDVICYVEAMKTYNAIRAEFGGTVTAICVNPGDAVSEDDVLMKIG
ncbi:biotin/lipoyl-containing protein [Bacteroides xylanisolvens]|jgi:pyruvate carboxylase subunit B|uniref:biotin/lipoyl-containing protein n=1 Tax=Bacteroides xylanisolvens TaxID=371601 RepID=UPI0023A94C06|nr:biotin/lipoyl-containing protein [Bacteroides xylanisolvens]MDE5406244.1 oxaloacetate decarboxylase [Bacteroides xylanisolvens]